jgi:hypothetical protein
MHIGGTTIYGSAVTSGLEYFDKETGERKLCTLDRTRDTITVADALSSVDIVGHGGFVRPSAENPVEVIDNKASLSSYSRCHSSS